MRKKILILLLIVLTLIFVAQIYTTVNAIPMRLYCCCMQWTYNDDAHKWVCTKQRCGADVSYECAPIF